jgi:hypothetical protein
VDKFYCPYTFLKNTGVVTYQLALPSHSTIHPIFHVSFLKRVIGTKSHAQTSLLELDEKVSIWLHLQAILYQRELHLHRCIIKEFVLHGKDTTRVDAT